MGIHKGTRLTENPKNNTFKFRYDDETARKLDELSKHSNKSKADIIRNGIDIQYKRIKK